MEVKKRVNSTINQCKNCGSNLLFDPLSQNLKCFSCGSEVEIKKNKDIERKELNTDAKQKAKHSWNKDIKIFKCENCGGEILIDSNAISSGCQYCGSSHICETQKLPGLVPDAIIPFQFDKNVAKTKFKQGVAKKFFLPNAFKKNVDPEKIHPFYLPSFRFSATTSTDYDGIVTQIRTRTVNGKTETYTVRKIVRGSIKSVFQDLSVEASEKMTPTEIGWILPYDNKDMVVFEQEFIRGFSAEHYSDTLENCHKVAIKQMIDNIKQQIANKHGVSVINLGSVKIYTTPSDEKYVYCLLPIYNVEVDFKGKKYLSKINGQTGKVGGKFPKSVVKISFAVGFLILFIAIIVVLSCL